MSNQKTPRDHGEVYVGWYLTSPDSFELETWLHLRLNVPSPGLYRSRTRRFILHRESNYRVSKDKWYKIVQRYKLDRGLI